MKCNYPKKHHVPCSIESWQLYNRKYFRGAISIAWTMWEESETTARDCLLLLYLYVSIILSHSPRWREGRGEEQCIPHKDKLNFDLVIFGTDARYTDDESICTLIYDFSGAIWIGSEHWKKKVVVSTLIYLMKQNFFTSPNLEKC